MYVEDLSTIVTIKVDSTLLGDSCPPLTKGGRKNFVAPRSTGECQSMNALPAPLVPPNCDLRGLDWMPINGHRLYGSDFYARALQNPRGGLAAQKLWWVAWQQCPAGSLPNNEHALARFADFGSDMRGWARAQETALYGFIPCSDGRLYHPVICEAVRNAWNRRKKATEKKQVQRERVHEAGQAQPTGAQVAANRLPNGRRSVANRTCTEVGKSSKNIELSSAVPRDVSAERRREERRNSELPGGVWCG